MKHNVSISDIYRYVEYHNPRSPFFDSLTMIPLRHYVGSSSSHTPLMRLNRMSGVVAASAFRASFKMVSKTWGFVVLQFLYWFDELCTV